MPSALYLRMPGARNFCRSTSPRYFSAGNPSLSNIARKNRGSVTAIMAIAAASVPIYGFVNK